MFHKLKDLRSIELNKKKKHHSFKFKNMLALLSNDKICYNKTDITEKLSLIALINGPLGRGLNNIFQIKFFALICLYRFSDFIILHTLRMFLYSSLFCPIRLWLGTSDPCRPFRTDVYVGSNIDLESLLSHIQGSSVQISTILKTSLGSHSEVKECPDASD